MIAPKGHVICKQTIGHLVIGACLKLQVKNMRPASILDEINAVSTHRRSDDLNVQCVDKLSAFQEMWYYLCCFLLYQVLQRTIKLLLFTHDSEPFNPFSRIIPCPLAIDKHLSIFLTSITSDEQHCVTKTVEAISFLYRLLICFLDQCFVRKGAHQQQQRRARQVKIGNYGIHDAKAVARCNEQPCAPMEWLNSISVKPCHALQHTHRGCAYCDDPSTGLSRFIDQFSRRSIQVDLLAVHLMFAGVLVLHGPKGVQPHVQRHEADAHSQLEQLLE